jgi:hypothetical protein
MKLSTTGDAMPNMRVRAGPPEFMPVRLVWEAPLDRAWHVNLTLPQGEHMSENEGQ